ncbi:hypothetical protein BD324DRAFT_427794 [Kockovaella imperatae]|uniref:Uncharacterized protein n=1 Tax=Kockovaella imperatae TaxID=4999 RepID=A0A1Y1UGD5_9TREE|nr:hypothetical protein BD324DRAFT_427794 [Kockovaella imperatae]ORX37130.1 hypothetical protein BD324DRAFT_427794 [Kockovaella imperatae]
MYTPPRRALVPTSNHPNIPSSTFAYRMDKEMDMASAYSSIGLKMEESDSEVSSCAPSPCLATREGRCFCGRDVTGSEGGIYCSVACARSDAFSSLCYRSNGPNGNLSSNTSTSSSSQQPTSQPLSRTPSANSTASSSEDWTASHYRRLARAESRRDERREERKRRRADGLSTSSSSSASRSTVVSTSSSASRNVPELVGGGHARNHSVASTASSAYTVSSLSRNPSLASTASSRRHPGIHVDSVIMEDDEEVWMKPMDSSKPYATPHRKTHRRKGSASALSQSRKKRLEGLGMGKDMRDVLEEIIRMEKGFSLPDQVDRLDPVDNEGPPPGLFTAAFDRPPRTPSPMMVDRKGQAPGAPKVHRRSITSHHGVPLDMSSDIRGLPPLPPTTSRPASFVGGHHSSLSESHTALYLATASPARHNLHPFELMTGVPDRRSASPKLQARRSLTFTPEADGPSISTLPSHPAMRDSFNALTPSKRRGNISPSAFHPSMDGWRFPSSVGSSRARSASGNMSLGSNTATPTRPPPINTNVPNPSLCTPSHSRTRRSPTERAETPGGPVLLWPANGGLPIPPPPLAPALFPCSPANATPDFAPQHIAPVGGVPGSGLRLGNLLLDEEDDDDDVDMEDSSTAHGHGGERGYLPVFLEAEGFRSQGREW